MKKLILGSVLAAQLFAQAGMAQSLADGTVVAVRQESRVILTLHAMDESIAQKVYTFDNAAKAEAALASANSELAQSACIEGEKIPARETIQGMAARVVREPGYTQGVNTSSGEIFESVVECQKSRFTLAARRVWLKSIASDYSARP